MTRFSVIVPMWSAEAFLDECLLSVRNQAGADFEIIAVDDHSPDGCGAIIDRHALDDERVTAVQLDRSNGVGPARNAGIARTRGDYLLFLDADDTFFDQGVLAGIDADLRSTGEPDILLFDYEERRPCGLPRRVGTDRSMTLDSARLVPTSERANALQASWVSWNKAYRRDFVAANGLRFPTGYYEDFAWSITALLTAGQIAESGRLGVRYRRCLSTSLSSAVNRRQLEVFDQFDRILGYLAAHPEHDSAEARDVLAAGARSFLRDLTERLRVIPPELLDDFQRRSEKLAASLGGRR